MEKLININHFNGNSYDKILPDNVTLAVKQLYGLNESNNINDIISKLSTAPVFTDMYEETVEDFFDTVTPLQLPYDFNSIRTFKNKVLGIYSQRSRNDQVFYFKYSEDEGKTFSDCNIDTEIFIPYTYWTSSPSFRFLSNDNICVVFGDLVNSDCTKRYILTSNDGINWASYIYNINESPNYIYYYGLYDNGFVLLSGTQVMYSENGQIWQVKSNLSLPNSRIFSFTKIDNKYYIGRENRHIITSEDLINWTDTQVTMRRYDGASLRALFKKDNKFIGYWYYYFANANRLYYSDSVDGGATWNNINEIQSFASHELFDWFFIGEDKNNPYLITKVSGYVYIFRFNLDSPRSRGTQVLSLQNVYAPDLKNPIYALSKNKIYIRGNNRGTINFTQNKKIRYGQATTIGGDLLFNMPVSNIHTFIYEGTGTSGVNNPTEFVIPEWTKIVLIQRLTNSAANFGIFISLLPRSINIEPSSLSNQFQTSATINQLSNRKISCYSSGADYQFNSSGYKYKCYCFG